MIRGQFTAETPQYAEAAQRRKREKRERRVGRYVFLCVFSALSVPLR